MDIVDGLVILALLFIIIQIILGIVEVFIVSMILRRTPHRLYHIAVPVWILLIGLFLVSSRSVNDIIFVSFLLIVPMASLLPISIFPRFTDPETSLGRIVVSYIVVSVFQALFLYSFGMSGRYAQADYIFSGNLYTTVVSYSGIVFADMLAASLVFIVLLHVLPFHAATVEKTE